MSDNKIRIISAEYDHVPDEEAVQRTVEFLNANITADKIYYRSYDFPSVVVYRCSNTSTAAAILNTSSAPAAMRTFPLSGGASRWIRR